MGRIGKIFEFVRSVRANQNDAKVSDVKIDTGGGDLRTAEHFAPPGDDSNPMLTDYVITQDVPQEGREAVVGYADTINEPKAMQGDKRIYARKEDDGTVIVDLWLKNDGTAIITNENGIFQVDPNGSIKGSNANGSFELEAGGDFLVNGVKIDTNGKVTGVAELEVDGKEIKNHIHDGVTTGVGNTGPNQ